MDKLKYWRQFAQFENVTTAMRGELKYSPAIPEEEGEEEGEEGAQGMGHHSHRCYRCSKCGVNFDELYRDDLDLDNMLIADMQGNFSESRVQLLHEADEITTNPYDADATSQGRSSTDSSDEDDPRNSGKDDTYQKIRRPTAYRVGMGSQPVNIIKRLSDEVQQPKSMSLPLRPMAVNPFPELGNSPLTPTRSYIRSESSKSSPNSPMVRRAGSASLVSPSGVKLEDLLSNSPPSDHETEHVSWSPSNGTKTMLNFYNGERNHRSVLVEDSMNACDVAHLLILKNRAIDDKSWTVVERLARFDLFRSLEDHESVLHVFRSWAHNENNKFYFRRDYQKYELFQDPTQCFPQHMVDMDGMADQTGSQDLLPQSERTKKLLLQNLYSSSERMPDIQGYLQMKDGKKSWKKYFFVLRKSGLYYSTKGTSKDPRYLYLVSGLSDVNIYTANSAKKTLGAPNNFCICLKPQYCISDVRELKCFCAEDEQSRTCWTTSMRMIKYGSKMVENFKTALKREEKLQSGDSRGNGYKTQENLYVKSRVAMDFTSPVGGRVVDDPNEALGVAAEEAKSWRRKAAPRTSKSSPSSAASPSRGQSELCRPTYDLESGVHMAQAWFYGGISREESVHIITNHSLVDGIFLIRQSQSTPGTYVLSVAHHHKVKHCQIKKLEKNGQVFFSLDGGQTKFSDLIQLVEFYQLNTGGLPTRLTHCVTKLV